MPEAIVLVNTDIGSEEEVLNLLSTIDGVTEAYVVYGVYDLVIKVSAPTTEELKDIISSRIRKLPKVRSTLTMIVVEGRTRK
ncbi:MAG: Lrp/AsnC ligand binding domain-containing protein [Sulfolobales archaeon]|nr:Lrp/AsnC ligand binding domain-containing protein [Sulfolobales archaeon]MCX8185618.1 Lrp/AsnC ligand binding domain-containing protein [Sulfolobales archaeon]MDW7969561.1 Lrp/AsnC ligand binding domain-containing protein [Sulfolobales archaeon]